VRKERLNGATKKTSGFITKSLWVGSSVLNKVVCLSVLNKSKLVDAAKNGRLINVFHCQEVKEVGGIYVTKKTCICRCF
jgi:hypothetical protein